MGNRGGCLRRPGPPRPGHWRKSCLDLLPARLQGAASDGHERAATPSCSFWMRPPLWPPSAALRRVPAQPPGRVPGGLASGVARGGSGSRPEPGDDRPSATPGTDRPRPCRAAGSLSAGRPGRWAARHAGGTAHGRPAGLAGRPVALELDGYSEPQPLRPASQMRILTLTSTARGTAGFCPAVHLSACQPR